MSSLKVRIAIVDAQPLDAGVLAALFEAAPSVERVTLFSTPDGLESAFENDDVNALVIDIFSIGQAEGIRLVERTRERFPHAPVCLTGTSEQLALLPGVPEEWRKRFRHYYRLPNGKPVDVLGRQAATIADGLASYLVSRKAQVRLRDLRDLFARHQSELVRFGSDAEHRIKETIDVAEKAIEARMAGRPVFAPIVPGLGESDVQILVTSTLERASNALDRSVYANMGILAAGALLAVASFVVATITGSWEAVAFGGFGIAGVIASLITNPLRSIGLAARQLVQVQVAYLGFLNQVRLLTLPAGTPDETQVLERSRQLAAATVETLKSLEAHFG